MATPIDKPYDRNKMLPNTQTKPVTKATAKNVFNFEPYGTGKPIEMLHYSYNDTHMFATIDGIEYVTEIDEGQNAYLRRLSGDDFIGPACLFDKASYGLIEREAQKREDAASYAERDMEYHDEE